MIKLYLQGHSFRYEMENVARSFARDVSVIQGQPPSGAEEYVFLRRSISNGKTRLLCVVKGYYFKAYKDCWLNADVSEDVCETELARLLYDVLCLTVKKAPDWGIVTGIRPAKYAAAMLENGMSEQGVLWELSARRRVSIAKATLALETAKNGLRLAQLNTPKSYSLYVSIPFCPTRCSYCSFIAKTVDRDRGQTDIYLDRLCEELSYTADIAKELGLRLESIYVGGGTPTVLTAQQLDRLCRQIGASYDVSGVREYCVEAGRPDTITPEKLDVLRAAGVTRLSINPQTANDRVLAAIGRNHTAADIERAFEQARTAGFDNINADLIAGLPCDDIGSFMKTMNWLFALAPENITLHALTLKRASTMNEYGGRPSRDAAGMVDYATGKLRERGYVPYYMYKQKGTVGGLENTGWALPGTECLYNVYMMDELHTILACGAGAVTKLVDLQGQNIQRIYNYKYPAEYLSGFDRLIERKENIKRFYGKTGI